ncbi:hypothetical protein [Streptomyces nigrescens]
MRAAQAGSDTAAARICAGGDEEGARGFVEAVGVRSNAMVVVSAGRGVPKRRTDRLHERLVSRGFGGPPPGVR